MNEVQEPDRVPMSRRERDVLTVMRGVLSGERTQVEAARPTATVETHMDLLERWLRGPRRGARNFCRPPTSDNKLSSGVGSGVRPGIRPVGAARAGGEQRRRGAVGEPPRPVVAAGGAGVAGRTGGDRGATGRDGGDAVRDSPPAVSRDRREESRRGWRGKGARDGQAEAATAVVRVQSPQAVGRPPVAKRRKTVTPAGPASGHFYWGLTIRPLTPLPAPAAAGTLPSPCCASQLVGAAHLGWRSHLRQAACGHGEANEP